MKRLFLATLLTILAPHLVFASMGSAYFFEPSIGYRNEQVKLTDKLNNLSQFKMATPVYGLKLGLRTMMGIDFNLAGDYSSGSTEWSPVNEKVNFKHTSAAAQLGINALGLMKIYLGYAFLNNLEVEKGLLNSDLTLKGPAYQAGIQFRLFSAVSIGAQYNLNLFNQVSGINYTNGEKTETYFNKLDAEDYSLNLSLSF
ncbi:MAG: hypothetical protein H7328_10840 [Bdellovibrio sp.]|nr:hypothetical protein [Bdellovibrio sp.]